MTYPILSPHYVFTPCSTCDSTELNPNPKPKITPQDIQSMNSNFVMSPTSYGYGPAHLTIENGFAYLKTSGRLERYPANDPWGTPAVQAFEESSGNMYSWYSAANNEPPSKHNHIPIMPDIAYIYGGESRLHLPDRRDTDVDLNINKRIIGAVHPNKIGNYVSKIANLEQLIRNGLWDDANRYKAKELLWIKLLEQYGFSIDKSKDKSKKDITALGVEVDVGNEGYVAAYYQRKGILIVEEDFHNKVVALTSRYGLTDREAIEAMKIADIEHEFGHHLGIKGDASSEKLQGLLRAKFYSKLAENYKGTNKESDRRLARIYKALAREGMDYAERFSSLKGKIRDITSNPYSNKITPLELLVDKFRVEAEELGLEGSKAERYVKNRLEETYEGMAGEEPSYKSSGKKSGGNEKSKLDGEETNSNKTDKGD